MSSGPTLDELPEGARVGTCSPRRRAFLAAARSGLRFEDLRGNVPTRLRAVDDGDVDAVVLAVAGLRRLGVGDRVTQIFEPGVMLPAAAQGALAIQIRDDDRSVAEIVAVIDDPDARAQVTAERACLRALEAGCHAPVGALAQTRGDSIWLDVAVLAPARTVWASAAGPAADAAALGIAAAREALDGLGIESLREADWAGPAPVRAPDPEAGR